MSSGGRALLPALAVVVPAMILAVLSWRAHRAEALLLRERFAQDQAAILRLVGARLTEEVRKALGDLAERCRDRVPEEGLEARFVATHPVARHIFVVRSGQLLYPTVPDPVASDEGRRRQADELLFDTDVRQYIGRLRERRRLRRLIDLGLRAEYAGDLDRAQRQYRLAAKSEEAPAARAVLGLARIARQRGDLPEAMRLFEQLRQRFAGLTDDLEVSYALMGDVGLVEIGRRDLLLAIHQRLMDNAYVTSRASRRFYLRWVVRQLEQRLSGSRAVSAATSAPTAEPLTRAAVERIRRQTAALFASDRFGRLLRRFGIAERSIGGTEALALDDRTMLLMRRDGDTVVGFALRAGVLRRRVVEQQQKLVSAGRGIELALQRVGEIADTSDEVIHRTALGEPLGHWMLTASRSSADPLAALQRRSQLRYFGMVGGLVLLLAAGLLFTYRGVRRESELARLKSDFASNVSHELKTPLTSIRMYAEMLQEGIADSVEARRRYQQVIIRESERLGQLIANVLDFSRVERGTRRYDLRREDLSEIVESTVMTFRRLSEEEKTVVDFQSAAERLPAVDADREAASQSIFNLLSNAAKYSPDDPRIAVDLVMGEGELGVEVRDKGIGIPVAEQKRIFDDFYRAPQARQVGVEGTGLGLALVKRHMTACGGRVEVQSVAGQGSRFTLWFPVSQEKDGADNRRDRGR